MYAASFKMLMSINLQAEKSINLMREQPIMRLLTVHAE